MKASHFNIGDPKGNMLHPKPVTSVSALFPAPQYNVEEAKLRLS